MHPELLKRTVKACRDYIEAGDCHGEPPPVERLIDAVVQLADQLPQILVRREEYDALSLAARQRLGEVAEAARKRMAENYHEGRARLGGVALGAPPSTNFKCVYCGWVGAVNPSAPACGNSRCVEPYPGKCADGAARLDGEQR